MFKILIWCIRRPPVIVPRKQSVYRESSCRSTVRSRGYIVWNLTIRKYVIVECLHMFKCILTHKLRMFGQ